MHKETDINENAKRRQEIEDLSVRALGVVGNFEMNPGIEHAPLDLTPASMKDDYGRITDLPGAVIVAEDTLKHISKVFGSLIKDSQKIEMGTSELEVVTFNNPKSKAGKFYLTIERGKPADNADKETVPVVPLVHLDRKKPTEYLSRQKRLKGLGKKAIKSASKGLSEFSKEFLEADSRRTFK